jgi:hypothetical protein
MTEDRTDGLAGQLGDVDRNGSDGGSGVADRGPRGRGYLGTKRG